MSSASETPNLTGEDASMVFAVLNSYFNEIIVFGLMHGNPKHLLCFPASDVEYFRDIYLYLCYNVMEYLFVLSSLASVRYV